MPLALLLVASAAPSSVSICLSLLLPPPSFFLLGGLLDLVHRVANHSLSLVRGIPHRLLCGLDGIGLLHLLVTQEGEEDVVADLDGVDVELFYLLCVCVGVCELLSRENGA